MKKHSIAIHGGAGNEKRTSISVQKEKEVKDGLTSALMIGHRILELGGSALDAVEAAVAELENIPVFNAGKGAVFSHKGKHELDASIMCGNTLKAGAVASVRNIKNPIILARSVMERTKYVFLSGKGAAEFAASIHLETVPDDYYYTAHRFEALQKALQKENAEENHMGTVGAVALDSDGNLAAATSTGGVTNKKYGRIGDTPLIGSGTYANNEACAVSCTGQGELFIRCVAAYDVFALVNYKGFLLKEACDEVIHKKLKNLNGAGGLIAIDKLGNIEMSHNTEIMFRAMKKHNGPLYIEI